MYEGCLIQHFFMPGFIHKLLINKSVDVDVQMPKQLFSNEKISNKEAEEEERAKNLSILLGYDAMSEDINQGQMKELMEQSVGVFDFSNFGLGEE